MFGCCCCCLFVYLYQYELMDIYLYFFLSLFIYFCKRQRQCEWGRGRERERERVCESQAGSASSAQSPVWVSNSGNQEFMTWDKTKSWTLNRLSYPGTPSLYFGLWSNTTLFIWLHKLLQLNYWYCRGLCVPLTYLCQYRFFFLLSFEHFLNSGTTRCKIV